MSRCFFVFLITKFDGDVCTKKLGAIFDPFVTFTSKDVVEHSSHNMYVGISWGMNQIISLPTYIEGNAPKQLSLKTTFISGSLYLPSNVLIPPPHKPTSSQHPLCLRAHLIYGTTGHLRRNGGLPLLYIFLNCPKP